MTEREQLLKNTESLERSTQNLDRAYTLALETVDIGTVILNNLDDQGKQIKRLHEKNIHVDANLGRTRTLLNRLSCEASKQKIVGWVSVMLLVLIFILVLVLKLQK